MRGGQVHTGAGGRSFRITFVCAVFPPEPAPAGVMAGQLAECLQEDGHEIAIVVPFPNRPGGEVYDGYRRRLRHVEYFGRVRIIRCFHTLIGRRRRHWARLLENATFGLSAAWAAWREGRPDVMLIETWPLFAAQLSVWMARLRRIPAVFYVKDVYPEALEYAGMIPGNGLLARTLRAWDRRICFSSARLVVISEGMKRLLCESRGLPEEKVTVIPDWLDPSLFPLLPKDVGWRESVGVPASKFVVLFAGTLGHVSGAEILVNVAEKLRAHSDILILCVGEGVLKGRMGVAAQREGLNNLVFLPFQPLGKIAQMHASVDATLLTVQPNYPDASVPSKLITYLAAGRPVICAAPSTSTAAETVRAAHAGFVTDPGDAGAIAEAVLRIRRSPEKAAEMGAGARACFLEYYTIDRAHERFKRLLEELSGER